MPNEPTDLKKADEDEIVTRLRHALPEGAAPEVQLEALRTLRSMERWDAVKTAVGILAFAGCFVVSCMTTCGPW